MPFLCVFPFLICKNRYNIPCLTGIWTRFMICQGLHPVVGMISTPEATLIVVCSPTPSFYRWEAEAPGHRARIRSNLGHWGQHLLKGVKLVLIYLLLVCMYLFLHISTGVHIIHTQTTNRAFLFISVATVIRKKEKLISSVLTWVSW